eukprot:GHVR01108911.1.p1 GENE.GHVR01108911.1~~GHVR01108911.1.p1  ORF type:complete len:125 (+),score=15.34 GHVR01108911.1:102-476(+)
MFASFINTFVLLYWISNFNSKWRRMRSDMHQPRDFTIMISHPGKNVPSAQVVLDHFNKLFKQDAHTTVCVNMCITRNELVKSVNKYISAKYGDNSSNENNKTHVDDAYEDVQIKRKFITPSKYL